MLRASREVGINLEPYLPHFAYFFERLTSANESLNLTAIRDERGVLLKHFADSLTCLTYDGFVDGISVIDVGTGAGFPGLPLAIVRPKIQFDLLDATQKKIDFVDSVIQGLGLPNAKVLWGRSEELSHQIVKRETYGAAVARAVASVQVLAELTLPLVKLGGFVLIQKGAEVQGELEAAKGALEKLGGSLKRIMRLELPILGDTRNLVIIEKTSPTPAHYPRRTGVPAKNPLS